MPGLFNRIKVWGTSDTLTAADLNAEFDNVITNFVPQMMAGYSATVTQMQTQTNPGGIGTESLATSLSGELERIRFVLSEITGNTYWYQAPVSSLSQLNSALGASALNNKVASGLTNGVTGSLQPIFLLPDGTTNKVTLKAGTVPLVYSIGGITYTISTDQSITGLTVAPSTTNTALVADTTLAGAEWTKIQGENGSVITISTAGANVTSKVGQIVAFKNQTSSEYFIGKLDSTTKITDCRRGYFFNQTNAIISRAALTNGDTLQIMQLSWIYATTSGGITVTYTNPTYSGTAPTSPATGDYWFDLVNNLWKIYNGTSFVASNATLIGVCIQDTTKTVGARSNDFFQSFTDLNTAELILDSTSATTVRSRYVGAQVSVDGTTLPFLQGYLSWTAPTNNAAAVTVSAGNWYYFYVDRVGNTIIDSVPPYDRRTDLRGFYHPANTFRCLGYAYATGSNTFSSTVETFYRADTAGIIATITAATTNPIPFPNNAIANNYVLAMDTSGGYSQKLPPVAAYKGKSITLYKTNNDYVQNYIFGFESASGPTTTYNAVRSQTTMTVASATGITVGMAAVPNGNEFYRNTYVTATSGTTITVSQPFPVSVTGGTVGFYPAQGLIGDSHFISLSTYGELWTLYSDGNKWIVREHTYPQSWVAFPSNAAGTWMTASGGGLAYGTVAENILRWRRVGDSQHIIWNYTQTAAGTAGSGNYIWQQFSGGVNWNVSYTGTTSGGGTNSQGGVGQFRGWSSLNTALLTGTARLLNATQFSTDFIFLPAAGSSTGGTIFGASSSANPGTASSTINYSFDLMIPCVNWMG